MINLDFFCARSGAWHTPEEMIEKLEAIEGIVYARVTDRGNLSVRFTTNQTNSGEGNRTVHYTYTELAEGQRLGSPNERNIINLANALFDAGIRR